MQALQSNYIKLLLCLAQKSKDFQGFCLKFKDFSRWCKPCELQAPQQHSLWFLKSVNSNGIIRITHSTKQKFVSTRCTLHPHAATTVYPKCHHNLSSSYLHVKELTPQVKRLQAFTWLRIFFFHTVSQPLQSLQ